MNIVCVGDIAEQIRGVTYAKPDATKDAIEGTVPLLRANNIGDMGLQFDDLIHVNTARVSAKQLLRQGDILVAASSGSLTVVGKSAQVFEPFNATFGAFCKVVRPTKRVHDRYLGHFFRTPAYRAKISSLAAGANINNLKNEHINELKIPLPSLDEQRRIAAILDQTDKLVRERTQSISKLAALRAAVLDQTIETFPCIDTKLGDLVAEFRYGTSEKAGLTGSPVLRIPNVIGDEVILDDLKHVRLSEAETGRLMLRPDDLLFVRTNGNKEYVARSALVSANLGDCIGLKPSNFVYASYLIRARLHPGSINPVYLQAFLSSPIGRRSALARSKTSAGQFNINVEGLAAIGVRLPSLKVQKEFADFVGALARQVAMHREHLEELRSLFASLQYRAFSSELTRSDERLLEPA